jgi:multicomponent Na+:H+ antiporter subunit G
MIVLSIFFFVSGFLLSQTDSGISSLQDFSLANVLVSLKLLAILVFVFLASPTAANAITGSALINGIKPWSKGDTTR